MSEKHEKIDMNPVQGTPSDNNEDENLDKNLEDRDEFDEKLYSFGRFIRKGLAGDVLAKNAIKSQAGVIVIVGFFLVLGTGNRYSCQQAHIRETELKKELSDAKNKAFSSFSLLTEKSRRSKLMEGLKAMNDSSLHVSEQPPYIVEIPQKETNE